MAFDYDLFVIGAGSGGVRAARMAAPTGARVAIAEERYLGGTCVNVGCIPKKLFVYASHYSEDFVDAAGFGWSVGERTFDWPTLIANKNVEIERLNGIYERMLDSAGVERIEGTAKITGPQSVSIGGREITCENLLVATGAWPHLPDTRGIEHAISSNEAFFLEEFPKRVVVVGGGYIAVEFAGIFHGLGAEVTQLYRGELFLRGFDEDCRTTLAEEMRKKEIDLRFETDVAKIELAPNGSRVLTLTTGDTIECDIVMYATGRVPKVDGLGLEAAGVKQGRKGEILVDEYSRTNVPSVWAIGDVTDRLQLTPMAIVEGMAFVQTLYHDNPTAPNHMNVPTAVFSQPNIGTVGMTEAEAREEYGDVVIFREQFRPMKHTLTGSDEKTMMKLIVDRETDKVLGCHMVGPDAGEIMQGLGIAIQCGATKAQFDATVALHPTSAEEFVTMRTPVAE
jgi:glutathione reductase (NADPH)